MLKQYRLLWLTGSLLEYLFLTPLISRGGQERAARLGGQRARPALKCDPGQALSALTTQCCCEREALPPPFLPLFCHSPCTHRLGFTVPY